jgi:hypothetical protein
VQVLLVALSYGLFSTALIGVGSFFLLFFLISSAIFPLRLILKTMFCGFRGFFFFFQLTGCLASFKVV